MAPQDHHQCLPQRDRESKACPAAVTLSKHYVGGRPDTPSRPTCEQQDLLDRYLKAWEAHDVDGFVALLKDDASFTMLPWLQWSTGREAIRAFFGIAWKTCGGLRLVPTAANGQAAFAVYERVDHCWHAHAIHVLTIEDQLISSLTAFQPPTGPNLFSAFALPLVLSGAAET